MLKKNKVLIVLSLASLIILTSAVFSFTAANTVPATRLGEGDNTISGYVVTDVDYAASDAYPSMLTSVTLTLDAPADFVKISLSATSPSFVDCTNTSGNIWSCTTTGATVLAADTLVVVAGD